MQTAILNLLAHNLLKTLKLPPSTCLHTTHQKLLKLPSSTCSRATRQKLSNHNPQLAHKQLVKNSQTATLNLLTSNLSKTLKLQLSTCSWAKLWLCLWSCSFYNYVCLSYCVFSILLFFALSFLSRDLYCCICLINSNSNSESQILIVLVSSMQFKSTQILIMFLSCSDQLFTCSWATSNQIIKNSNSLLTYN